jgi:signal transduction histidine kinase
MSSQTLIAQEVERKRIARELHDDTAQALTSVLLRLRVLERSTDDAGLREGLAELRDLTGATLEGVRRMAIDLRPSVLDDFGLEIALQAQVRDFESQWNIKAKVTSRRLGRISPEVELVLYRIAQEALSNIAKHARASQVEIRLTRRGRMLRMFIEDDGCGFDAEAAAEPHQSRLGLFGMKERLSLIGGTFGITSTPGSGTRVSAQVWLSASARA